MTRPRTTLAAVLALVVLLAGCASVPTEGPIRSGSGIGDIGDPPYGVQPQPPRPGSGARAIVNDFLDAMGVNASLDILRQYLTPAEAARWKPADGVTVFDRNGRQSIQEERAADGSTTVSLNAPKVATLDPRGAWQTAATNRDGVRFDFKLVRVGGQLRISQAPPGRLVATDLFTTNFRAYNLYFFTPKLDALVPDPVYLPIRSSAAQTATTLAQALLAGPTPRLTGAVVSAAPQGTEAVSVTLDPDGDGVATVGLNDRIDPLGPDQRLKLAAQFAWTLRQVTGVFKLKVTAGGQPYEIDTTTSELSVDRFDSYDAAFASATGRRLYVMNPGWRSELNNPTPLRLLDTTDSSAPTVAKLFGLPATGGLESMAIDLDGRNAATVTDGKVVVGPLSTSKPARDDTVDVDTDGRVLRPSFDKDRNLWIVDRADDRARIRVRRDNGTVVTVRAPALEDRPIVAFRVARDGVRVLVAVADGSRSQLFLGRITRTERTVAILGLQQIQIGLNRIVDVGWTNATKIMVLGRGPSPANQLVEANIDGSQQVPIQGNGVQDFDPVELAVAPDGDAPPTVRNGDPGTGLVLIRQRDLGWIALDTLRGHPVYPG